MIAAVADKIDAGSCKSFAWIRSKDESWYNWQAPPRLRIARHMQYEEYLLHEVVPLIRQKNRDPRLMAAGIAASAAITQSISLCAIRRS